MDVNTTRKHLHDEMPKILSNLEETQKKLSSNQLESRNITSKQGWDMLNKYKLDLHEMVEKHFDNLKLSYLSLCATVPCKESAHLVNEFLDDTKQELKAFHDRFNSEVTDLDIKSYRSRQFDKKKAKLADIIGVLVGPKAPNNVTFEEPEIIVNSKVYSKLYHTLCEFITTSIYHNTPEIQQVEKNGGLLINRPDYFINPDRVLPVINEEQKTLSVYSLLHDRSTTIGLNFGQEIPYSASNLITPDSIIYLCGGVLSNGNLSNKCYNFQTNKDTLGELSSMVVKKVGHSLCYVNPGGTGGSIYSIGGRTNDSVRTKICEKYSVLENKWEKIALMNSARSRAAVCPFNDVFIYAFYGTGSDMVNVLTCERYEIKLNVWKKIEIYNDFSGFEVSFAGAVQINENQILVFGGFSENEQEKGAITFSKKLATFNVNNETFRLNLDQLPLDFSLSNSCTPIIDNREIFCLGFFMKSMKPQTRFLDCDYVLKISEQNCEVRNLILPEKKSTQTSGTKVQESVVLKKI